MVAHLVRLRFLILANSLKKSPWQIVAVVIGALYGLGILAAVVAGLVALSFGSLEVARTVVTLGGAAVILGWWLIPIVTAGIDQTVDTARLVTFPIPLNTLVVGLTVSGVLGVPGIVTSVASLATIVTWRNSAPAAIAALICAAIAVLTCVIGSRLVAALATNLGSGRRFREAKGVLIFIPLILLGPILIGLSSVLSSAADALPDIATVIGWTPLGAIWAVPASIAEGSYGAAVVQFLIGIVTVGILAVLWRMSLARALETPPHSAAVKAGVRTIGLFGVFPATPWGAVAARALTYWLRDPRYAQSLIIVPVLPLLLFFYSGSFGSNALLNATGPIVALLLALSIYTDVSYDNTAYALHLEKGVSGVADRLGRVVALTVFGLPITLILCIASVWFTDAWRILPGLLGVSVGTFLSGLALSSVISGRLVFAVPAPGESPFKARPGGGFTLALTTFATWGGLAVLALPEVVLAVIGFVTGNALFGWLALLVGAVFGGALLVIGIRWGGAILDRRGPELLAQLQAQK
ncbi:transporter [Glaciihabitans sp. dw_435]|uniref:transporter n=1 Tax=Glaciihabitans sp. dw_435 TaxID=2720081 RepID=UPI001BD43C5A|nr:transporter [Glaciihabitans sp. dw_435]